MRTQALNRLLMFLSLVVFMTGSGRIWAMDEPCLHRQTKRQSSKKTKSSTQRCPFGSSTVMPMAKNCSGNFHRNTLVADGLLSPISTLDATLRT